MIDKYTRGYEEALRRIKANAKTKEFALNLRGLGIETIPREIGRLDHLIELRLGSSDYTLESYNYLRYLPKEIGELKKLKILSVHSNNLQELPKEIGQLINLETLYLFRNSLRFLPKEIGQLSKLEILDLSINVLIELPEEIGRLKNLKKISLSANLLQKLPKEIGQLTNLTTLYIDQNQLVELPDEVLRLNKLNALKIFRNPLKLPPEIENRTTEPKVVFNYYFENLVGAERPLNEIKMLLLGEGEVGKSALVHRLIDDKFVTTNKTEGIDIHKWNVAVKKNCNIQINVWDFAGQEITHATHQFFLTKRSLYLLVLASRGDEKSNRLEEWLKVIQNLGGASPVIVVCNKSDEHQMNLDERALREKYPNIREIVKVSCKKGTNTKKLKQIILKEIRQMPHVFDPFSKRWFNVKQRLEDLKENYIPFEDYLKICDEEDVIEDIDRETLIKFLHDLGVVLNFRDDRRLNDTNVLKPEWITEGVYKILTSKTLDDAHGVLTLEMVGKILDNRRYPKHKHHFIVQMMQKFERCFPLKTDETFLVPDLLPKQQPDFGDWKPEETGLGFQYHYEIEPGSFITRFIVNMNEYIDKDIYWRKGVVLKNADGNRALIKTDLEDKIIYIWIDGKMEAQRGFLSMIRKQFEKIHKTMLNLKVTEYVQHEKGLILYESLLKLEGKGIRKHYFPDIDDEIDVRKMLNGFESPNERMNRMIRQSVTTYKARGDLPKGYEIDLMSAQYDVALSFAGEDRDYVREVYEELAINNISVFYDDDEEINIDLWGKELVETLDDIYRKRSKCVVIFVSENYKKKVWTKLERRSSLANALNEHREYVLPARLDDTEIPGILPTIKFEDLRKQTPQIFAQKIIRKLEKL